MNGMMSKAERLAAWADAAGVGEWPTGPGGCVVFWFDRRERGEPGELEPNAWDPADSRVKAAWIAGAAEPGSYGVIVDADTPLAMVWAEQIARAS